VQLKTRVGGVTAWTKRSKTSGEFMAVKKPAEEGGEEVQGCAAGEDVKGSDFLEVVITAAAMAASVNPLSVRSPCLARSRSWRRCASALHGWPVLSESVHKLC
jgi:hypothetical protein